MLRLSFAFLLGAGLIAGTVGQADAAKRSKDTMVVSGCTSFQVPFCTMIKSGSKTYSLVGAPTPIPFNVGVTVVGTKTGDVGLCFAPTITVAKWSRNRLHCPK